MIKLALRTNNMRLHVQIPITRTEASESNTRNVVIGPGYITKAKFTMNKQQKIGQGSFGAVSKGVNLSTKNKVAIKYFSVFGDNNAKMLHVLVYL